MYLVCAISIRSLLAPCFFGPPSFGTQACIVESFHPGVWLTVHGQVKKLRTIERTASYEKAAQNKLPALLLGQALPSPKGGPHSQNLQKNSTFVQFTEFAAIRYNTNWMLCTTLFVFLLIPPVQLCSYDCLVGSQVPNQCAASLCKNTLGGSVVLLLFIHHGYVGKYSIIS